MNLTIYTNCRECYAKYNSNFCKGDITMNSKLLPVFLSITALSLLVMALMRTRPLTSRILLGLVIIICLVGILNIKKQ